MFKLTSGNFVITGSECSQTVMQLSQVWPCRRSRWWCVITSPALGKILLQQWTEDSTRQSIRTVMPTTPEWPAAEVAQLELDAYELRNFHENSPGLQQLEVDLSHVFPTALHSWRNQLQGCRCGCRSDGFRHERIEARGLWAPLFIEGVKWPRYRHPHPAEVAILSGMMPLECTSGDQRLDLCAVGQLASPIQSLWIFSQVHSWAINRFGLPPMLASPTQLLAKFKQELVVTCQALLTPCIPKQV